MLSNWELNAIQSHVLHFFNIFATTLMLNNKNLNRVCCNLRVSLSFEKQPETHCNLEQTVQQVGSTLVFLVYFRNELRRSILKTPF